MNHQDTLQKFLFENAPVRGELVHLNHSFQSITQQHNYPPMIERLLGEALAIVSLLSATIKFKGRITVQFQGKGKLKLLVAQCNHELHIRGLAQWDNELDEADLLSAFENGLLAIIMEHDETTQRYEGIVAWEGNSLARSIEAYFKNSEQLLTRIWLAVDETHAAGLFLQAIPEKEELFLEAQPLTEKLEWEHLVHLASTITPIELLTLSNETILYRLYSQENIRLFETSPITFRCTCSQTRSENAILMLGRKDVEEELLSKPNIVITCEFCSKQYIFDRVDIETIFRKGGTASLPTDIQ